MADTKDFEGLMREAASGGRTDPFLLNFLFAMGELSGQVKALTVELSNIRKDRAVEAAAYEETIKGLREDIGKLKAWRWYVTSLAAVGAAVLTFIGNYLIYGR